MGPAWILGRNPKARIIVATYNETRAAELGNDFRKLVQSAAFKDIFPKFELALGSKSSTSMKTTLGGRIFFVGLGGTVTGRTADYFIIDDPMKDDEELQSPLFREKMWKWFFSVAYSRGSKRTRMIVLHTRWHADDLIGRLCDPSHPERERRYKGIAADWFYLNISGVIRDKKLADLLGLRLVSQTEHKVVEAFGTEPISALWEEDKDLAFFAQWKNGDPRTFSALVMGQPTIEDGEYFTKASIVEYDLAELPKNLKIYGASDHAVSEKQNRDESVVGCIGIDEDDNIWVLPDIVMAQMPTDRTVEELIVQFKVHAPLLWWMESELISKSFGPFLHKRMTEERVYITIETVTPSKDKQIRARAIQGRMSMGKVRFPRFAPWWARAKSQVLQFPYGAHDDFVDWLAHIGMGLMREQRPHAPEAKPHVYVPPAQKIMNDTFKRVATRQREKAAAGW
jgi:predicted phage terminase large subunit-like protein